MVLSANDLGFLTIGAAVCLVGLLRLWGDIAFTGSRVAGKAEVVGKHYRDDTNSEYSPPPRKYLLRCVLIEGGKPLTRASVANSGPMD
jgi:hypothetical protein